MSWSALYANGFAQRSERIIIAPLAIVRDDFSNDSGQLWNASDCYRGFTNMGAWSSVRGRLRTNAARRFKRVDNAAAMIWKLLRIGEKAWRCLKGAELLRDVYEGKKFIDGKIVKKADKVKAAAA
jgi:hypothetical protein